MSEWREEGDGERTRFDASDSHDNSNEVSQDAGVAADTSNESNTDSGPSEIANMLTSDESGGDRSSDHGSPHEDSGNGSTTGNESGGPSSGSQESGDDQPDDHQPSNQGSGNHAHDSAFGGSGFIDDLSGEHEPQLISSVTLNGTEPARMSSPASGRVYSEGLAITVNTPHKISEGSSGYVSYLVTSTRPGMESERVRRRFSEFARLYTQLLVEFPAAAVPPLPDHSRLEYLAGDRFSDNFTHKRAAALERFLFRVACHPDLCSSRSLAAFLTPNVRQTNNNGLNGGSPDGVLDQLSDTLLNAFSKVKNQSKEMVEARERADRFEHAIAMIDKAATHLVKHEGSLHGDLSDMSQQATRLAALDKDIAREFEVLARTAKALSGAFGELHSSNDAQFAGALRDMSRYVKALKQMLKQREQKQIDYEALVDYLQRTEQDFAALQQGSTSTSPSSFLRTKVNDLRGVDKEQSRQARQNRLEMRMSELRLEVNRAKKVSDQFEEIAKREVAVFEATEALEMKSCLAGFTKAHIAFYRRVLDDCKAIEAELV